MTQSVKNVSIRGVTLRYLTIIFLVALIGVLMVAGVGAYSSYEAAKRHEAIELNVLSGDIGGLVGFYRQIAVALARQQELVDILQFGDVGRAEQWAKEIRSLVPESIGVALIDKQGEVLGEPLQLKLGKQCVRDLEHMMQGASLNQPPVHRSVHALQHFDVIVPVSYAGESQGLLFISFSLDILQRRVNERIGEGQYLSIREASGEVVVAAGDQELSDERAGGGEEMAIEGTDWSMYYSSGREGGDRLFLLAVLVGAIIFTVTSILTLFLSARIFRFFSADLNLIRGQLDRVHSGNDSNVAVGNTHLRETEAIMADISGLVQKIEQNSSRLKQQSMHDALTGLYNRRAFDEALVHHAELASRGAGARLVLLDVDLFKQVNDRYGHGVGDEVLIALAESLRERCRSSDILARLGGDEFAVILTGGAEHELHAWFGELERMFEQRQERINGGEGVEPHCRISAGSAPLDAACRGDVKSILAQADRQLYEAKRAGGATIRN